MSAAEQQAAALQQLRSEVQAQAQRDLMTKMTEKCFAKCAANSKGGSRLERSEQMCVGMCLPCVCRHDVDMMWGKKIQEDNVNGR